MSVGRHNTRLRSAAAGEEEEKEEEEREVRLSLDVPALFASGIEAQVGGYSNALYRTHSIGNKFQDASSWVQ